VISSDGSPQLVGRIGRGRLAACLFVASFCLYAVGPSLLATFHPPAGRIYSGSFFYIDDYYQYLSFVEPAARGELFFTNKFDLTAHEPVYFNLAFWLAGRLAWCAGGDPRHGFLLFQGLVAAGFALTLLRLLRLAGASSRRIVWALPLVCLGGGLGWLRLIQHARLDHIVDLMYAIFPGQQGLFAPFALCGATLLLSSLIDYLRWRQARGSKWRWLATGWILGLSRPFDFGVLALVIAVLEGREWRVRRSARGLGEWIWLAPVFFYDGLVLLFHPSFSVWSGSQNTVGLPPWYEFVSALGPVALMVALSVRKSDVPPTIKGALLAWIGATIVLLASGLSFAAQFATSMGLAFLALAAVSVRERFLPAAAAGLSPSSFVLLWLSLHPAPDWFVPADYAQAVGHLRQACRAGDVVYAPYDPSLMVAGLTPCSVALGHRVLTPHMSARAAESFVFYDPRTSARWRGSYLERIGARFVMIPAGRGEWLAGTRYARRHVLGILEIWEWAGESS
jgi:hypothetical protein